MIYDTFYAKLVPNGAVTGTKYSVSISGVTAIVDGQKTYTGADMYFAITPKSSGNATVTFRNDTTGDVIGTRPILIRSTTLAVPTYTLTASATSVNEGGTVTFSIDTSDVTVGTNIAYAITGVSVADINLASLTGNFSVTANGTALLPIKIIEDNTLEGPETLTLTLDGKGLSKSVTINDTSNIKYTGTVFEVGIWEQDTNITHYGYSQENGWLGRELSDELTYDNKLADLRYCTYLKLQDGVGGIQVNIGNTAVVDSNSVFKFKLTNLTTNMSITTDNFTYNLMSIPGSTAWDATLSPDDIIKANQMFVVGQKISVELIQAHTGVGTFTVGSQTQAPDVYNIGYVNYPNVSTKVGVELNDDLKINNQLIDMVACYILNVPSSSSVSLFFSYNNPNIITENMGIIIKLTNLSNNTTYVSDPLSWVMVGVDSDKSLGINESRASQVAALRSIMTTGTNVKAEISYIDTNAVSLDVIGTLVKTETYNSKSYDIGWGVNAYDYFVSKMGRQPLVGENIRFNVLPNTALVATDVGTGAIHFDARLNNVGNITITSAGIILGRGNPGRGANVIGDGLSFVGGPAISNVSSKSITVYNTNIIAGGGGGGASVSGTWNNVDGGGGAPWGENNASSIPNVSFSKAGSGVHGGGGRYSGSGGDWGKPGKGNSEMGYGNWSEPGKVIYGSGTIINQGDGVSLGR